MPVEFAFENGTTNSKSYSFYTATDFTFVADLTANDSTRVKGVTFIVHTTTKEVRKLKGFFDGNLGRWVAVSRFDSYNLPVNLNLDVEASTEIIGDRQKLDDDLEHQNEIFNEDRTELAEYDKLFYAINNDGEPSVYSHLMDLLSDNTSSIEDVITIVDKLSDIMMN